jgi:O-antigen biosynthesis protein
MQRMSSQAVHFNPLAYPVAMANVEWMSGTSGWIGHAPFAMALMQMLAPRLLVELGTYKGDSYFAFCQAVAALGLTTRCCAIDTWRGDPQAGMMPDGDQVLAALRGYHDPRYSQFSTLMQSDFDAAAPGFADGSIDLLHIDGCHTYDAVKNDYQTWRPKLSDRAIVLFHDTQVRDPGFGVHQFWTELIPGKPHFEFHHAAGLGVIAVGTHAPAPFMHFLSTATQAPDVVRQYFTRLGERLILVVNNNHLARQAQART